MRKLFGLMALLAALAAFVVPTSAAAEETPSSSQEAPSASEEAASAGEPIAPSELSPLSQSECPENAMCAWEGREFNGNFSWWPASSTGCHSHSGNSNLRSFWNRTGYWVRLGGWGELEPHQTLWLVSGSITGELCWPSR